MFANQYPNNQAPLQQSMTQVQSQSNCQYPQLAPQGFQNFGNQNQISQMEQNQNAQNFAANQQMVMIDQNELLELLQIKQQLMQQKMAAQTAAPQQVKPLYEGQGFQSALFVSPPKTEMKENLNSSNSNSTHRSSDSGENSQISEPKTKSQIIQAPKHTSLFSMDFLDDESNDEPVEQLSARSQEQQKADEDIMKIIGESSIDLSQDMPSSISSNHESGNSSFEEQTSAAQEFFPQAVAQALYFPPLQQVQQAVQQPSIAMVNELAFATRSAGGVKPLHQTFTPTFTAFQPSLQVVEQASQSQVDKSNEFKFPDGGWECSKCQNYNFKGRKECHRCKKSKDTEDCEGMPNHLSMSPNQRAVAKKQGLLKNKKTVTQVESTTECEEKPCCASKVAPVHKKIQERVGDWTCQRCFNHNFAFRDVCNMCYMSHIESNKLLYGQQNQRFEQIQNLNQFVPQQPYQQFQMQMPVMQQPTMSCNAPSWTPQFSNY